MRIKIKSKKEPGHSGTPSPWVAMGALTACAATCGGPSTLLKAQQPSAGSGASSRAEQNLPVFRLAIEAGPLGEALAAFEKATGWKVEIPDAGMTTLPSKGVSGVLPAPQALRQIMAGTGLNYRVTRLGHAIIQFQEVCSTAEVTERTPWWASPRYTEPLRDHPAAVQLTGMHDDLIRMWAEL